MNGFLSIRPVFFNSEPTFESSFWFVFDGAGCLASDVPDDREAVGAGLVAEEEAGLAAFLDLTFAAGDTVGSLGKGVASEAVAATAG